MVWLPVRSMATLGDLAISGMSSLGADHLDGRTLSIVRYQTAPLRTI